MADNFNTIDDEGYKEWLTNHKGNFPYYNPASYTISKNNNQELVELFPVMASELIYNGSSKHLSSSDLGRAKSAGFTVCRLGSVGTLDIGPVLCYAKENNIKVTFMNGDFLLDTDKDGNVVSSGKGIKAYTGDLEIWLGGIGLSDEPTYSQIVGDTDEDDKLKSRYWNLLSQNPSCVVLINLVGAPVSYFMNEPVDDCKDSEIKKQRVYTEYVRAFQQNFKPSVFSYDLYPFSEFSKLLYEGISRIRFTDKCNGTNLHEGTVLFEEDNFYRPLWIYSSFQTLYNRPFWVFCQSMSFMVLNQQLFRPIAKENFLRFEAFMPLAFGAQGITYWTYAMRDNGSNESFFSAIMNRKGERTAVWYFAKRINDEIARYKDVFLNSKADPVIYLAPGETYIFPLTSGSLEFTCEKGLRISHLRNSTGEYLMIVNNSPFEYQNVVIKSGVSVILELTPITSNRDYNLPLASGNNQRILIPGGYRIFKIGG